MSAAAQICYFSADAKNLRAGLPLQLATYLPDWRYDFLWLEAMSAGW
jgi:hypothetical protein